jgi:hypothetical protein
MYYLEFLELIKTKHKHIETERYKSLIENEKKINQQKNDENALLLIWFCLSVINAVGLYSEAFLFMKNREYNKGWNKLAQVEVIIHNIKYNISDYSTYIICLFLEQSVIKFQKIYPYKVFTSNVFIATDEECSICGKSMNPFYGCDHIRGKVYAGKVCYSIVKGVDWIGHDFVENPAIKSSVVFNEINNPARYNLLEFIMPKLSDEYTNWDYKITTEYEPHSNLTIGRNEKCPCQSGQKYKHCCMNNPKGIKYELYNFMFPDRSLDQEYRINHI